MGLLEKFYKADADIGERIAAAREDETARAALLVEGQKNREVILAQLGHWYLTTEAKLAGKKAEYQPILDQIKDDLRSYESELEFIKTTISSLIPASDSRLVTSTISLSYLRSETVEIDDLDLIPLELADLVTKPNKKAIKKAIEKAIEEGQEIPGAHVEEHWNLQIKSSSEKKAIEEGRGKS